ncbi:MAG: UDP-N-acetylmuramoyl-tripeptide--D-alanyl-D-alanine ligase [Verrucomicrobiota bacterium]|nr:UDP-N-acetylmuramoyl-tripeptide--D-alanyl-D-alanine ligase [Verrucomicrobiota bacterium]
MPTFSTTDLAAWTCGTWTREAACALEGVCNDTRALAPGALYVAIHGPNFDGHDFVTEAFRRGARGAVVSRAWPGSASAGAQPLLAVEDTRQALRDMARGHAERVGAEIVVVTGSAGKTSVKDLAAGMLAAAAPTARTPGNWNNDVGLPLSLLNMEPGARIGVFELGVSHPGEMAALCEMLRPAWAVITNIGPVHIEFFGSLDAIAREKACALKRLPPRGAAVLNRDGNCYELLRSLSPARVLSVSMKGEADYRCLQRNAAMNEAVVRETASGETFRFRLAVPGEHNVMNAMMAIAVARGHGASWDGIRAAIEAFSPMPMRWETATIGGVTVINDAYNANPMSMRMALRALAETEPSRRRWLVLGGMLELGAIERKEHFSLGQFAGAGTWAGLIAVGRLGGLIADGAAAAGFRKDRIFRCDGVAGAAETIRAHARDGDVALLKASRGIRLENVVKRWKNGAG